MTPFEKRAVNFSAGSLLRAFATSYQRSEAEIAAATTAYLQHLAQSPFKEPAPRRVIVNYDVARKEIHLVAGAELLAVWSPDRVETAEEWAERIAAEREDNARAAEITPREQPAQRSDSE